MNATTKAGKIADSIRRGLEDALAYAKGTADASQYHVDAQHCEKLATEQSSRPARCRGPGLLRKGSQ